MASAGSYANSGFNAANTADTKAVNSGLYANGAFIQANAAFLAANNVAPQIEPAFSKANSAYAKAAKLHAIAVNRNKKITAGPPSKLAFPMVLKIPAPTIAAIPKAVKSLTPKVLFKD